MNDARLTSPAAARNRGPILDVLRTVLPREGLVLEIASGSGEHVTHFAAALPTLIFQPSDPDAGARDSIVAWIADARVTNVRPPLRLDVTEGRWPVDRADAILCINMAHISPWRATERLFEGAGSILPDDAPLFLYGPFKRRGQHTAPSNDAFDASLRARDPAWGVRDLEAVIACAAACGFIGPAVHEMPANNLGLVFRRGRASPGR